MKVNVINDQNIKKIDIKKIKEVVKTVFKTGDWRSFL